MNVLMSSVNEINYIQNFSPIFWSRVILLFLRILECESLAIGNAKLLSFFDIAQGCVGDKEVREITIPSNILSKVTMVEHASKAKNHCLGHGMCRLGGIYQILGSRGWLVRPIATM